MPDLPEIPQLVIPPRKIERVIKPALDFPAINKIAEHIMENKKMSPYQVSLYDTNKDGNVTIDEMLGAIKTINNLVVFSVVPSENLEAGKTKPLSPGGDYTAGGESDPGGGGA